jgi:hypothetical protein
VIISLFVIRPDELDEAWRSTAISVLTSARPRGRLAGLLGGAAAETMSAARALPPLGAATARRAYAALVEDLAVAALHDVPAAALRRLWANLELQLELAEPAFPEELAGSRELLLLPTPAPPAAPVDLPLASAVLDSLLPLLTSAARSDVAIIAKIA